jgi:alpha-tubulin suppressor-like RCC1 family protein
MWSFSTRRASPAALAAALLASAACDDGQFPTAPGAPGTATLTVEAAAAEFASVSAGVSHSCGVTTAGAAYCWGYNIYGALGNGTNRDSNRPVAVSGGHIFAYVDAGSFHSCGVTTAGAAYCWGYNEFGQLGNGTNTDSNVPRRVRRNHG